MAGHRKLLIGLFALLLIGGGGYFAYTRLRPSNGASPAPTLQTAVVEEGDIVLSSLGSGNLLPSEEVALGFESSGTLEEVLVELGDWVEKGDVLARLDDTNFELDVAQAEIDLRLAEINLAELQKEAEGTGSEMASAKANLYSTQVALNSLVEGLTPEELEIARIDLESSKQSLDQARNQLYQAQIQRDGTLGDVGVKDYQEKAAEASVLVSEINVAKAEGAYEQARLNYEQQLAGATDEEIAAARAKVVQAQASLDALKVGETDLQMAELAVEQASNTLKLAQKALQNSTLIAPISGVVLSLDAKTGQNLASDSTILTLGDLKAPVVRFWVEEQDMSSLAEGTSVNISFEALPEYTFTGEIFNIEPTLVTVDNVSAVQAWTTVDMTDSSVALLSGMTAEVEVIGGEARGVLLVPLQALRELSDGHYAVFVMGAGGELTLRPVEVGLKDYINAEIISGLEKGEVVRIGEDSGSNISVPSFEGPGGGGGEMMPPPGGGTGMFMGGS